MSQEVKVGIGANLGAAEAAVARVDKATAGVAESVKDISQEARGATRDLNALEASARRLAQTRQILSRELGRNVSDGDAGVFLNNHDKLRRGRTPGAQRVRAFDDFGEWYNGHSGLFSRTADAEKHRRFVIRQGMQGTNYSRDHGAPQVPAGGGGGGGGGGAPQEPNFRGGMQRAQSMAMGFVKGGLALAGINSVMGMAGAALDSANEESIGTDKLKRSMGDLSADFESLRGQARRAAEGLGVTYVESIRMAQQFSHTAGNLRGDENLEGQLRTNNKFAKAFGIGGDESTQFFGTMRRLGATGGAADQDGRRMAGFIADAIERSGYGGKADDIIEAVSNFSDNIARYSLSRPNVLGFAGMMAGLTRTGLPGLDPANAAAMLSTADQSVRRGGNFGEASQNLQMMALMKASPGMDPFAAKALQQGGLFASTRSIFGKGAGLEGMFKGPLDDVTNLQKIRDQIKRFYGDGSAGIEAFGNETGLSMAQSKALYNASPLELEQAKDFEARAGEKNPGTQTAESIASLQRELTRIGAGLQEPINKIRDAVVAIAGYLMPHEPSAAAVVERHAQDDPAAAGYLKQFPTKGRAIGRAFRADATRMAQNALLGRRAGSRIDPFNPGIHTPESDAMFAARTKHVGEVDSWIEGMTESDRLLHLKSGSTLRQFLKESPTGNTLDPSAVSPKGAMGMAQFMPGTLKAYAPRFAKKYGHDPDPFNPNDAVLLNRMMMGDLLSKYGGDQSKALSAYNSGRPIPDNPETKDYVSTIMGHQLPKGAAAATAAQTGVHVRVTADPVPLIDPKTGAQRGVVNLKTHSQPVPSGMTQIGAKASF